MNKLHTYLQRRPLPPATFSFEQGHPRCRRRRAVAAQALRRVGRAAVGQSHAQESLALLGQLGARLRQLQLGFGELAVQRGGQRGEGRPRGLRVWCAQVSRLVSCK